MLFKTTSIISTIFFFIFTGNMVYANKPVDKKNDVIYIQTIPNGNFFYYKKNYYFKIIHPGKKFIQLSNDKNMNELKILHNKGYFKKLNAMLVKRSLDATLIYFLKDKKKHVSMKSLDLGVNGLYYNKKSDYIIYMLKPESGYKVVKLNRNINLAKSIFIIDGDACASCGGEGL